MGAGVIIREKLTGRHPGTDVVGYATGFDQQLHAVILELSRAPRWESLGIGCSFGLEMAGDPLWGPLISWWAAS